MSSVKLAIRVRPFTENELRSEKDRVAVVSVLDNNTVAITNIKVSVSGAGDSRERVRKYHADYTFDSSCPATDQSYASQQKVFDDIGQEVLASVSRGCSACVLAYGQSATGKTHTMMGSEAQPGLIPRLCKALYEHQQIEVTVSFLEIYNERVHDLLVGEAVPTCHSLPRRRGNARKDLRVREHPSKGTYVQNLRRVAVQDAESLLSLVAEGARRRQTAATRRNTTSSRSHALIEIATPYATLHLADLAGSEKASWEGCGGGRQKEGANINKSLVALSNVISALVSGGAGRGRFVPYRDSALTWLLKDCFTGGARAFIIATVSPSVACYGESASTLRWASRARQLPTPRAATCGATVASRATLLAQLNQLIAELARNHIRYISETGEIAYDDQHWTLHQKDDITNCDDLDKTTAIGNIMDKIYPKTDAKNSESIASSVASGSLDVIDAVDKSILTNEINKEIDKLFTPVLERTCSGDNLKVVAPLRHKRRQYRSQEVLPLDEASNGQNHNLINTLPSQSEIQINNMQRTEKSKAPPITILHDNQRAEIVASVTERLYTKLKKKEEAAVSKVESIVDRKIVEPLSELKICTNARQRLVELSQKALRNKRRIGIPAHTQTKTTVTRVRDQAIDVQSDLLSCVMQNSRLYTLSHDATTETNSPAPRCKEVAVGPTGSLEFQDKGTETKKVIRKNSLMMTDMVLKYDCCSQTPAIVPPPRRKRRSNLTKHLCGDNKQNCSEEYSSIPVISINISQMCPLDSASQSSDDNLDNVAKTNVSSIATLTPDLLTNHSAAFKTNNVPDGKNEKASIHEKEQINEHMIVTENEHLDSQHETDEFSDTDDYTLPRVTVNTAGKTKYSELKNIILGRNQNVYPYNIVLSPPKSRDNYKRIVKFNDEAQTTTVCSKNSWDVESNVTKSNCTEKRDYSGHGSIQSDSTESDKTETDSFIWKKNTESKTLGCLRKKYMPVYKNKMKYQTSKDKLYKDIFEPEGYFDGNHKSYSIRTSPDCLKEISSSDDWDNSSQQIRNRKPYGSYNCDYNEMERQLLDSCNDLKESVNKYESHVTNYKEDMHVDEKDSVRRPKDYLQHLLQLRRELVKSENYITDSSEDLFKE